MAQVTKVNVTTTAVQLIAANGNRKSVTFIHRGTANIFIASTNLVTAITGLTVRPQEAISFSGDPNEFWAIAAAGTQSVEIAEVI